jgi:nicotinamide mononucleotide transporter
LVHENWLYWIVIDTVSIYLYAKRGLKLGSVLFALYLLLALDGYFEAIQIF